METKINVAEILKDKPQGTKLYNWLNNIDVELNEVAIGDTETVIWCTREKEDYNELFGFSKLGTSRGWLDGLQILLPSREMRNWSKFAWKKGDVLVSKDNVYITFEEFEDDAYTRFKGKHYLWKEYDEEDYSKEETKMLTSKFEKVNNNDAQTYINTIEKRLGGKLNRVTLEIEKAQSFNNGDIIKMTWDKYSAIVIFWEYCNFKKGFDSYVFFNIKTKIIEYNIHGHTCQDVILREATEEEKQQLFSALAKRGKRWDAEKKQIVDLKPKVEMKPFDKVLVRDETSSKWRVNLFGYKDEDGYYNCVYANWIYCIPYEGNEHLLGTTKDVEG